MSQRTSRVNQRSRNVEWEDPAPGVAVMPTMSGLAYLQAMIAGSCRRRPSRS
ncbi:hypothetical protein ACRAWC_02445 [Leifsonia sp. L25]|uniref:hypothetical protein n=1 Tax=Leifsonia sp. L25 TaxID=3423957 RepID=UPI003D698AA2